MKPRSLFDNPDAWVAETFKRPPQPRSFVTLPKPRPAPEPKVEKIVAPAIPFPPLEQGMPYRTGCSPAVRQTIQAVASMAGVPMAKLVSHRRDIETAFVRHVAIWIARRFTNRSLPAIGSEVGGRDHTTVLHAVRKIDRMVSERGLSPPEDTQEAWVRALLAEYQADRDKQAAAYKARNLTSNRVYRYRRKAAGLPTRRRENHRVWRKSYESLQEFKAQRARRFREWRQRHKDDQDYKAKKKEYLRAWRNRRKELGL
jgi:hypothetical protein